MKTIGIILISLTLTGCGTFLTRCGNEPFGAHPYDAVVCDVQGVVEEEPDVKVLSLVSLPFDLVFDTMFLPLDLFFWHRGKTKDGIFAF